MSVEVGAGTVVAHRGPGIGMSRRDLGVAKIDPGVARMVVSNVCLSMCGCIRAILTPEAAWSRRAAGLLRVGPYGCRRD